MADTKLSALTELAATPANDDEIYIRDVSEAEADESKRITVTNLLAGAADYPMKIKPNLTRWVMPGWGWEDAADKGAAAGLIVYIPIFVEETTTYIRVGIWVVTSSAGSCDLRIFNWNNGLPDSLLLSVGSIDTGSTGIKEITISQQLTRGYYFLAYRCSATPLLKSLDAAKSWSSPIAGSRASGNFSDNWPLLAVSAAYADPAPAPTSNQTPGRLSVIMREN